MIDRPLSTETVTADEFRDIGLLTIGDGITVTKAKSRSPSMLVITWQEGHRRLYLDADEARALVGWIGAALPKEVT